MNEWVDVLDATALADGEHVLVEVDGVDVALFKCGTDWFAIENVCSHDGTEIASGEIDGTEIVCPRHGARFCLKTGQVQCGPAYEDIGSYAVQVVDGRIAVKAKA